jgi:hypothetical protein
MTLVGTMEQALAAIEAYEGLLAGWPETGDPHHAADAAPR